MLQNEINTKTCKNQNPYFTHSLQKTTQFFTLIREIALIVNVLITYIYTTANILLDEAIKLLNTSKPK